MQKFFVAVALLAIPLMIGGYLLLGDDGEEPRPDGQAEESAKDGQPGKIYDTHFTADEEATFEALVVLRDQEGPEAEALKRGDVLAVRKAPQEWSRTEETSYLIVPLRTIGKEAYSLLEPRKDGETVVRARHRHIDLTVIGFIGESVLSGQPLRGKVFGMESVKGH